VRIFIAGASGVLGRAFVPLALEGGHEVVGTTRSAVGAGVVRSLGATPVMADALDHDGLTRAVADARPDAIVDLLTDLAAGDSASNALLRTTGTRNLVDAAHAAGVDRIVATSISWVYSPGPGLATEDSPLDVDADEPRRTTIRGVRALEDAVREARVGVVLRLGQLYGDGTWFSRGGRQAEAARAGALPATETVASFVHVEDAARATLLALDWPAGTWNVVDDEPAPGTDWVPAFAAAVGAHTPRLAHAGDPGRPVDNARVRARGLTLRHPTWREGFRTL
jgi:nucleoside-diphosphate-sugar epimerase